MGKGKYTRVEKEVFCVCVCGFVCVWVFKRANCFEGKGGKDHQGWCPFVLTNGGLDTGRSRSCLALPGWDPGLSVPDPGLDNAFNLGGRNQALVEKRQAGPYCQMRVSFLALLCHSIAS